MSDACRNTSGEALEQQALDALKDAAPKLAPVKFYVVRHGQTLFNVMGRVQGWCDTPLTAEGVQGAEALGRGLARVDFKAAFSSDSGRAMQTLDAVLAARAACRGEKVAKPHNPFSLPVAAGAPAVPFPVVHDARLREWCYGDLEGEPGELLHQRFTEGFGREVPFEELNRRLSEVANIIASSDRSGRAEDFATIERRLRAFFEDMGRAAQQAGGGNVLVVTHAFVVRTLVYLLDPARVNDPLKILNASVTELIYDNGTFSLGAIGSTDWQA
ncbi:histidine phosphatase family protein [Eggerthella sp. YY7918]|uniref:histidine phosphatase family protein n=1 Tax=Eggerthella sp. (strain YY7918) TaxID=502558 RepID=UPI000217180D|nr:histidine phosphatase family protein [Eggerthella sp. YY7918]BAK44027.1 fructose-2,6-bisphosphatase [Eggerthella sp. YY7918]